MIRQVSSTEPRTVGYQGTAEHYSDGGLHHEEHTYIIV